jgi:hypothetical protein
MRRRDAIGAFLGLFGLGGVARAAPAERVVAEGVAWLGPAHREHPVLGILPEERERADWADGGRADPLLYLYCTVDRVTGRRLWAEGYKVARADAVAGTFRYPTGVIAVGPRGDWLRTTYADARRPIRIVLKACVHRGVYRPDLPPDWHNGEA